MCEGEKEYKILGDSENCNSRKCEPDYDNESYLHQLQEPHQWEMELQGAYMHHEGDSENSK